jgi:HD-like signal output (HDOD) protein
MDNTIETQKRPEESSVETKLEHSVKSIGIPACPKFLIRVIDETNKEEPDYNYLASIFNADVALSAGLIKTANSAYFGARQRVRSVREALTVLGLRATTRAIATIALRQAFPSTPSLERFWDSSARIARLSGWLAQQLNLPELTPEDAYTFGLFRDCGIAILLIAHSKAYEKILLDANNESILCFTSLEDKLLQVNHAIVGSNLAQNWRLPSEINLAIRQHHDINMLQLHDTRLPHILLGARLIALAQLSEHILQIKLGLSMTQEWAKLGSACLQVLNITPEHLAKLYEIATPVAEASND